MRIHGSSDYSPKAEANDAKRSTQNVSQAQGVKPVEDVAKGGTRPDVSLNSDKTTKAAGEAVVLSPTASRLAEVSSEQAAARSDRLSKVQSLLDAGTYEVDYEGLADSLLAEEVAKAKP